MAATFTPSSKQHPCKLCGRTKDGDCRESSEGFVLCHTVLNGVAKGQQHPDLPFVYCGMSDEGPGAGIWKPLELCETRTDKAPRKPATHYFDYTFWDGSPTPAQRYRKDIPGKPKEIKWCKGGLQGRSQADVAPYRWHKEHPLLDLGDTLFIVRGELKADLLAGRGFHAISLLNQHDERLITELRAFVSNGVSIVLAPDNDLVDLEKWYATITAAIPSAKTLLCPLKGMDWRTPPEDGGLGIEDWIARSQPSNDDILAAVSDAPWQSPWPIRSIDAITAAVEGDNAPGDEILIRQWGDGWTVTEDGTKQRTSLAAGDALDVLDRNLPEGFLRFNIVTRLVEAGGQPIAEPDMERLYAKAQQAGWRISKLACIDALYAIACANQFDPIQDYLNLVAADSQLKAADINTISTACLGTNDPLFDRYMKVALIGAVKRRFEPGCKFDTVVTLDGDGGIYKSEFWIVLASPDWHSSSDAEQDKDFLLILHGAWLYEQAELDYITSKKAVGQLKNQITTRIDDLRAPFGKGKEKLPRNGIMVGTVNGPFLRGDAALRRRFLVIQCPQSFDAGQRIDIDKVRQDRDAIWKAAVLAYRNGDPCFLDSETAARASRSNLDFAEDEHSWTNSIATWLSLPINAQGPHHSDDILRGAGVIALDRVPASGDYRELQRAMQHVPGWIKDREPTRHNGKKARYWRKAGTWDN